MQRNETRFDYKAFPQHTGKNGQETKAAMVPVCPSPVKGVGTAHDQELVSTELIYQRKAGDPAQSSKVTQHIPRSPLLIH